MQLITTAETAHVRKEHYLKMQTQYTMEFEIMQSVQLNNPDTVWCYEHYVQLEDAVYVQIWSEMYYTMRRLMCIIISTHFINFYLPAILLMKLTNMTKMNLCIYCAYLIKWFSFLYDLHEAHLT